MGICVFYMYIHIYVHTRCSAGFYRDAMYTGDSITRQKYFEKRIEAPSGLLISCYYLRFAFFFVFFCFFPDSYYQISGI